MSEELKPCPYCGCSEIMRIALKEFCSQVDETYCICPSCGLRGPYKNMEKTSEQAWNELPRFEIYSELEPCHLLANSNSNPPMDVSEQYKHEL